MAKKPQAKKPRRAARAYPPPRRAETTGKKGRSRTKKSKVKTFFKALAIAILACLVIGVGLGIWYYEKTELPDPNEEFTTQTTRLYFRDGSPLGQLSVQKRTVIGYDEMPQSIKDAAVAAEDRTFWTNSGVDLKGMIRAALRILRGGAIQGGSTITQQYIKILYLTSDQTVTRKLRELVLASKMNKAESKEQVLSGYLNTIYFGRNAYGVQAAANTFFGVDAKDMTLAQSAVLAAMLNGPSLYDPADGEESRERLLERYNWVLDGMYDPMGTITKEEHDANYNQLPEILEPTADNTFQGTNGYLIQMAIDELSAAGLTDDQINGGGLEITTTFDPTMQAAAVEAAQTTIAEAVANAQPIQGENGEMTQPDPSQLHVGLASIQVGTGEVMAIYGGDDYLVNSRNWATTPRFAASTFKAYGIVAGLRNGFSLQSVFKGSTFTPEGDDQPISNDSGVQYGPLTLEQATIYSANTAFVDMMSQIPNSTEELIRAANDAGVPEHSSWEAQGGRLVLGEGEVSAVSNATGYATLANDGKRNETHVVISAVDPTGKTVYSGNTVGTQTIEEDVATDTVSALAKSAEASQQAAVNCDVAGKTGTEGQTPAQNDGSATAITRAAWLAGFTKQLSTAVVMVAGDDGVQNLDVYAPWGSTFYGATYPTTVWNRYMGTVSKNLACQSFSPAANIRPTVANTLAPIVSVASPTEEPEPEPSVEPEQPEQTQAEPAPETTQPEQVEPSVPENPVPSEPEANPVISAGDGG